MMARCFIPQNYKLPILSVLLFLSSSSTKAQLYFPPVAGTAWDTFSPTKLGFCTARIDSLYQYLQVSKSKSFILLKDGKIVLEKYFGTFKRDSLWYWASAGKTLTSVAVGVAKQEGLLSLTDKSSKYLDTGWTSIPRNKEDLITIKHQITMTTGLNDAVSDPDCTSPSCLQYMADAGTRWAYHNAPYTLLDKVIEKASGTTLNLYVYSKITNPIGMKGMYYKIGSNNVFLSDSRSMARFGLLLLNKGKWNTTAILKDTNYFKEMTQSSQNLNLSYGYLTWLNGKTSFMVPQSQYVFNGSICANAPADNFMALGKNGQLINICPSKGYVWIRMGEDPNAGGLVAITLNDNIWKYINALSCNSNGLGPVTLSKSKLFPNPIQVGDVLNVQSTLNNPPVVVSAIGQLVNVSWRKVENGFTATTTELAPGLYSIVINSESFRLLVSQ